MFSAHLLVDGDAVDNLRVRCCACLWMDTPRVLIAHLPLASVVDATDTSSTPCTTLINCRCRFGDRLRVCPWDGVLDGQRWSTNCYCVGVEDPFNSDDNAARTVSDVRKVINAFQSSRHAFYAASISGALTRLMSGRWRGVER